MYASGDVSLYLYAVREPVLSIGDVRLTATTQCIHCSTSSMSLVVCTSVDVIHSWTLPTLGIKVDCVPGRANTTTLIHTIPGIVYGQCSEICGALHGYMPLCISSY